MKKTFGLPPLLILCLLLAAPAGFAWGPVGHRWVTRHALENLEEPLRGLLWRHRETLLRQCMAADYRKQIDPEEAARHYVDLEEYPPSTWDDAELDYPGLLRSLGRETLRRQGSGPWSAALTYHELVEALQQKDLDRILLKASDLAHYLADLHQPLHTTRNFDGQLTGQKGIHARLETGLLNRFQTRIRFQSRSPVDLGPVQPALKSMVQESHGRIEAILAADRSIVAELGIGGQRHSGPGQTNDYSEAYFRLLFQHTGPVVEDRLNRASHRLASLWWMAWNRAGQPRF